MPPNPAGAGYPSSILETDIAFTNYIYGYHYDGLNRLIQKKIPNKGWEYMIYNKLDQVVLSQDSVLRLTNQWIATKYDALGRVIITGLWPSAGQSQSALQTIYNNAPDWAIWDSRDHTDTITGYKIVTYALPAQFLTINYYDDYTNIPRLPPDFIVSGNSTMTKGLLTATKTLVLNTTYNSTLDMLCTAHYYDDLGRNVKTFQQHYLGGAPASPYNYDVITSTYNFTNQDTLVTRQHYIKNAGNTLAVPVVTVTNRYAYDHMGRKTQTFEKINSGMNILLSQTDYNPIGQVMAKHLHSATSAAPFLQDISYKYNERGWLKRINDPAIAPTATRMFSEQLNYDSVRFAATPKFNGNIAEQMFQAYNSPLPGQQHVVYVYDEMNRLNSGMSTTTLNETGIGYDEIGNIISLTRNGNTGTYAYTNNQLSTISGVTTSTYTYDGNGNTHHDGRNNADITYNLLNLPQSIASTAPATGINITYTYDANGQKLRKVSNGSSTDYIGGIQYKPDAATIDFIQTEEGRANNNAGTYTYEYTLTDHLGNNRVTFDQTNGKVGEEDYYPFGLNMHRQVNAGNKYLYNKKELQDELGQYDYGARFYDPVIARWTTVDPLAEISRRWSPYNYVVNNPIRFIDPDGMSQETHEEIEENEQRWAEEKEGFENAKNPNAIYGSGFEAQKTGKGDHKKLGTQTVNASYFAGEIDVDNGKGDDMAKLETYEGLGQPLQYNDGTLQNYITYNQNDPDRGIEYAAVYKDRNGNLTVFPGISVYDKYVEDGSAMTPGGRSIYASTANGINGLIDLEHEYGHFLDAWNKGFINYSSTVSIQSIQSAATKTQEKHLMETYELRATRLAIAFFGSNSQIAKKHSLYTKHLKDK